MIIINFFAESILLYNENEFNAYKSIEYEKNQNSQRGLPDSNGGNIGHFPNQCACIYTLFGCSVGN